MSSFVLDQDHISGMLRAVHYDRDGAYVYFDGEAYYIKQGDDLSVPGQILMDENYRQVNGRYDFLEEKAPRFSVVPVKHLEPVEIIRLINCWRYQSCDLDNYKETHAWAIATGLRDAAIDALPGYDAADWEYIKEMVQNETSR